MDMRFEASFNETALRVSHLYLFPQDPKLSIYVFDETFSAIRSRGSPLSLKSWYDTQVHIEKMCFVSGSEEICLIEDSGRARILSLVTQQFRWVYFAFHGEDAKASCCH